MSISKNAGNSNRLRVVVRGLRELSNFAFKYRFGLCYSLIQSQGKLAFSVELYHSLLKKKTRVFIAEEKKRAREIRRFIPTCAKAILGKKEDNVIFFSHLEIA
jgi:hypothetical protein